MSATRSNSKSTPRSKSSNAHSSPSQQGARMIPPSREDHHAQPASSPRPHRHARAGASQSPDRLSRLPGPGRQRRPRTRAAPDRLRSEENTSELQSHMPSSYAVSSQTKNKKYTNT